jgi:hypothetical protein
MDGRRARTVDPTLDGVPRIRRHPRAFSGGPLRGRPAQSQEGADRSFVAGRLSDAWAAVLGFGWPFTFIAITALEPAPADPDASVPLIVDVGAMVFLMTLALTCLAAATRSRVAGPAAVATGIVALTFAVSCPTSGHHDVGAWWLGELALLGAMTATSVAALGRRSLADPLT